MEIMEYILGERLILIPVLYIIGYFTKNSYLIKDKYIPLILLVLGMMFSVIMGGDTIINNVIQGILVAGATVLTNEVIKQSQKEE